MFSLKPFIPFLDGNGRLGRLLITLLLCSSGVLKEPMLYLSLYFKGHRERYYRLLNDVRLTGNWEAWIGFFTDAIIETATQAVNTTKNRLYSYVAYIDIMNQGAESP